MPARQEVTFVIKARDLTASVFRRIRRGIGGLRVRLAGLVGGIGLGAAIRDMLNFASSIDAASKRLDVNAQVLQALKIQAESANVPFESLVTIMQRLLSNAGEALGGSTDMAERFARLGLTLEDLQKLNADEMLFRIAEAAKAAGSDKTFRDALRDVGDTEIIKLLPLLRQGGARLAGETLRLIKQGATLGQDALRTAAEEEARVRKEIAEAQTAIREGLVTLIPELRRLVVQISNLVDHIQARGVGVVVGDAALDLAREVIPKFDEVAAETAKNQAFNAGNLFLDDDATSSIIQRAIEAKNKADPESLKLLRDIATNTRSNSAVLGR